MTKQVKLIGSTKSTTTETQRYG